ncbi:Acyl-CoA dehydrogenase [Naegleria gruberi]|uniref:acyl-CoA oxidase n=1 Tax=Naegleria gruberi TaxID=5762 RepID=D2VK93_NAEGR|nr:Acyl-CoA dehydrogenase [Naegleria gruberi]EFC42820.1 Acyl-CoA dehydrogenase [Naegleria gruberi]|eukprot:XP_002675564.1 Acyl-CoA dehydrogenase [Naegleria gruberi strain NEG-M]
MIGHNQLRRLSILANHLCSGFDVNNQSNIIEENSTSGGGRIYDPTLKTPPTIKTSFSLTQQDVHSIANNLLKPDYVELRQKLLDYFTKNQDYFKMYSGYDAKLEECRQKSHDRALKILSQEFVSPIDILKDPLKISLFLNSIPTDVSSLVKLSVHFNLFGACIAHLGTTEQLDKWLGPNSTFSKELGCFLMSELAHASNVRQLAVTATYDSSRNEFIINTPDEGAQKYWIGNAFKSATSGVLFAQCIVDGVNHGIHSFVVPLRDPKTMKVYDNILIRDVGIKMALNGIDNGMVAFNNYRIPASNLLARYAKINNGKYETTIKNENVRFAKHIGALLQARLGVGSGSINALQMALIVAIRYAHRREQFGPPKSNEWKLIEYKTHQMRLLPLLAESYAYNFFSSYCMKKYEEYMKSGFKEELLKNLHLLASVSKVVISSRNLDIIQECRESCGGQGVLTRNLLPILRVDSEANVTLDGDNHLLLYQISGVLLTEYAKQFKTLPNVKNNVFMSALTNIVGPSVDAINSIYIIGKEGVNDFWRNGLLTHYANTSKDHILSKEFLMGALQYRENRLVHTLASKMYKLTEKYKSLNNNTHTAQYLAHNEASTHSLNCAKAYCDKIIGQIFFEQLDSIKSSMGVYSNVYKIMQTMCQLFVLSIIAKDPFFLAKKVVGASKFKAIKKLREELATSLAGNSLQLIDAFAIPDFVLDGSIGARNFHYITLNGYNHEIQDM